MKISEVISKLQAIERQHGDIDVDYQASERNPYNMWIDQKSPAYDPKRHQLLEHPRRHDGIVSESHIIHFTRTNQA